MSAKTEHFDVVVVGGGPVGLFLGCELAARGLHFVILEQDRFPREHSRSIGIHPPALEHFARLGAALPLLQRGVRVERGMVFGSRGWLGELEFRGVSRMFPFVLLLPQYETESVLDAHLMTRSPEALRRGARVLQVRDEGQRVSVTCQHEGETRTLMARFVVGADGKRSVVRQNLNIPFQGAPYPDRYLMGDFADTTVYGPAAVIHLTEAGVVESFPLPGGLRRWVARIGEGAPSTPGLPLPAGTPMTAETPMTSETLCRLIFERTGQFVPAASCRMLSAFGVGRHLAEQFVSGRVILVGDAAHEVSPIGGQGMNLGWLDASELARVLAADLHAGFAGSRHLRRFAVRRRRLAQAAIRQAEFNMAFGRPWRSARQRDAAASLLLRPPVNALLARLFTMRWL